MKKKIIPLDTFKKLSHDEKNVFKLGISLEINIKATKVFTK